MLNQALEIPYGFAGFQSPTCLTLAETFRICRPEDQAAYNRALKKAEEAAHNIQDPLFCAKTTARVNAIRHRWGALGTTDLKETIENFCQDPSDAAFTSLHFVGERYKHRVSGEDKLEIPPWLMEAVSLRELQDVYQYPVEAFIRVNRHQSWTPDDHLTAGMDSVNVPDPGFSPLLAAKLAAEALAAESLSENERAEMKQRLVPIAVANPTALDTVLSRLLLAYPIEDKVVLQKLADIAAKHVEAGAPRGWMSEDFG